MEEAEVLVAMSSHVSLLNSKSSSVLMSVAMEPAHRVAKETVVVMAAMVEPYQHLHECVMGQRSQLVVAVAVVAVQLPIYMHLQAGSTTAMVRVEAEASLVAREDPVVAMRQPALMPVGQGQSVATEEVLRVAAKQAQPAHIQHLLEQKTGS